MSDKQYKAAVIIGRFQPFHNGHLQLMREALKVADKLIVIVGSTNIPRTPKNPFTYDERFKMIFGSLSSENVDIYPVEDTLYSNQSWASEVQFSVDAGTSARGKEIALVGHHRDASSFYLDMFPQWSFVEMPSFKDDISGTELRNELFNGNVPVDSVPRSTVRTLNSVTEDEFATLVAEHQYIKEYRKDWGTGPFITTDSVVVQSGHVLMIERGRLPGKGLWALPGGFLESDETIRAGILRELNEETCIKVPDKVLNGCIREIDVFDAPGRSERGRIITHAALIVLEDGHILPRVKAADDAKTARWVPISMMRRMRGEIFEDHYDIIFRMTSNL